MAPGRVAVHVPGDQHDAVLMLMGVCERVDKHILIETYGLARLGASRGWDGHRQPAVTVVSPC